jgi:hypothetical protein
MLVSSRKFLKNGSEPFRDGPEAESHQSEEQKFVRSAHM